MSDQERESRKRKLKKNVILGEKQKESPEEEVQGGRSRASVRRAVFMPLVFLLILTLGMLLFFYGKRRFSRISTRWITAFSDKEGSSAEYFSFADGVVKLSKDGASYLSKTGKLIWNQAYEMGTPVVSINGDFMAIGEKNGSKLFILSTSGPVGQGESPLPIEKLSISGKGVVYALLSDKDSTYITVFSKEGRNLDIGIRSVMSGDGYPMDFSASKDGEELLVAFSYLDQSVLKSRVVFYNFSSLGKNVGADRVVGGFTENFSGKMVGRVHFFTNEESFVAYNGGLSFFSTRVKTSPEEKKHESMEGTIRMISYNDNYLAVLTDNIKDPEKGNYRLVLFRKSGERLFDKPISYMGSRMEISGDKILLYQEKSYRVYDFNGLLRYNGSTEESLLYLRSAMDINLGGSDLILCFPGKVERVRIQ